MRSESDEREKQQQQQQKAKQNKQAEHAQRTDWELQAAKFGKCVKHTKKSYYFSISFPHFSLPAACQQLSRLHMGVFPARNRFMAAATIPLHRYAGLKR